METKKLAALAEDIKFLDKVFENLPAPIKSGLKKEMNSKEVKKYFEDLIDALNGGDVPGLGVMNFYPSASEVGCMEFCFAIATNKFGHEYKKDKKRTGFKGLIKELIKYWLSCSRTNKETEIIVLDWDSEAFEKEWKGIVDHYCSKLAKQVRIYEIMESDNSYVKRYGQ